MTERAAWSWRADPAVPPFDDAGPLIIFDGKCVLCSSGVQWMLKRDPAGVARFAAIQEEIPRALYAHYGLDADRFDTFLVMMNGKPHLRWAGLLAAARLLPAPWRWLGQAGRIVPGFIGNALYDVVQKNRLLWFGAREACLVPDTMQRQRFLAPASLGALP